MFSFRIAAIGLLLGLAGPNAAAGSDYCEKDAFEGNAFMVCTIDPQTDDLRLFLNGEDGRPYRQFKALADDLAGDGSELAFAFNAGMYDEAFSPTGLYVEDGQELQSINMRVVEGRPAQIPNFYKRPNGVFFLDETGASVMTTDDYVALSPSVRFATQSGPMLVIDGQLHPAFIKDRTIGRGGAASACVRTDWCG